MVKALDRHPAARRPYRRLFDRAARADEPGIHGRRTARISGGRRERDGGDRNVRLEAPITRTSDPRLGTESRRTSMEPAYPTVLTDQDHSLRARARGSNPETALC